MLTPDEITKLGYDAEELMDGVVEYLFKDIINSVLEAGKITNSVEYKIWLLKKYGLNNKKIIEGLNSHLVTPSSEANKLIKEAAESAYNNDFKRLNRSIIPLEKSPDVKQLINAMAALNNKYIGNLTHTIGFIGFDNKFNPLTDAYRKASEFAFKMVSSGAMDYNTAVFEATKNLISKGIKVVNYESGVVTDIGAAVRRNVMSTLGDLTNEISEHNHEELGATGWEISAHGACAEDHIDIQGKQYTDKQFERLNDSLKRRIGTLNCGHVAYPIYYGKTKPVYSDEELREMKKENDKGVYYEGKHYTLYEATQKQRQIERNIRKQKQKNEGYKQLNNKEEMNNGRTRLQQLYTLYNSFSKKCGLATRYARFRA